MMEAFLYATMVLVVGRVFWYDWDAPRSYRAVLSIGVTQATAIFATVSCSTWLSSILVLLSTLGLALLSKAESIWIFQERQSGYAEEVATGGSSTGSRGESPPCKPATPKCTAGVPSDRKGEIGRLLFRLLSLIFGVLALACAAADGGLSARTIVVDTVIVIASHLVFGDAILAAHWSALWARILGLVLCLVEASFVVRLALAVSKVSPTAAVESKFRHSAVVGYVERWLVFVFTQYQAFNAIAFILTAKSVVRLHDTTDPDSAEYVLVGTLCSTIVAIGIGLLINLVAA